MIVCGELFKYAEFGNTSLILAVPHILGLLHSARNMGPLSSHSLVPQGKLRLLNSKVMVY